MAFQWNLLIATAEWILVNYDRPPHAPAEALFRTVVGRSYYGAFGLAKRHLADNGTVIPRHNVHLFVRNRYLNSPDVGQRLIGTRLFALSAARNKADYSDSASVNSDDARNALDEAVAIVQDIDSLAEP